MNKNKRFIGWSIVYRDLDIQNVKDYDVLLSYSRKKHKEINEQISRLKNLRYVLIVDKYGELSPYYIEIYLLFRKSVNYEYLSSVFVSADIKEQLIDPKDMYFYLVEPDPYYELMDNQKVLFETLEIYGEYQKY